MKSMRAKHSAKAAKSSIIRNNSSKLAGTSSETTSSVIPKAKTMSASASMRETSPPRQRNQGSPPSSILKTCSRIMRSSRDGRQAGPPPPFPALAAARAPAGRNDQRPRRGGPMKYTRSLSLLLPALLLAVPAAAAAQDPLQELYDSAYVAWQDGAYPQALAQLERLLNAPGGERFLEPAALLTGELYHATEVAPDGRNIRFSADGRLVAYETGARETLRTHVIDISTGAPRELAQVAGTGLVFSPDGTRAAYIAPPSRPSAALKAAYDDLERLTAARANRQELIRRSRAIAVLEALE